MVGTVFPIPSSGGLEGTPINTALLFASLFLTRIEKVSFDLELSTGVMESDWGKKIEIGWFSDGHYSST